MSLANVDWFSNFCHCPLHRIQHVSVHCGAVQYFQASSTQNI